MGADGSRPKAVPLASLTGAQRRLISALLEAARPTSSAPDLVPDNKMDPAALEMPAGSGTEHQHAPRRPI